MAAINVAWLTRMLSFIANGGARQAKLAARAAVYLAANNLPAYKAMLTRIASDKAAVQAAIKTVIKAFFGAARVA